MSEEFLQMMAPDTVRVPGAAGCIERRQEEEEEEVEENEEEQEER